MAKVGQALKLSYQTLTCLLILGVIGDFERDIISLPTLALDLLILIGTSIVVTVISKKILRGV